MVKTTEAKETRPSPRVVPRHTPEKMNGTIEHVLCVMFDTKRAIDHAWETPEMAVKLAPLSVEWNKPLSVETQTSPVTFGLTMTRKGDVDEPREPAVENVRAPSVEM